ncbi:permease-like cell division protein FtsX [Flavobacterium sp. MXW15]|uniref:Cell division protein FtsX n=1 Tax=Xanthomonas chitinilytica TaxID=2989819 RepID=A0ABT3K097_9XANT|nr:permease-like cell division protein FtsX [Xanthomonas sp. H13-6]MCW4456476.1 permease-like cell division protein FtsX [Flavobacterium sp. MXW15]MCW4474144.1 permease-like cell division protein FtsX [Xanthomonas sp. H13-6]
MSRPANTGAAAPSRLGVWFDHHLHSIVFSLGRAVRKPWATLLTVAVMALALALPLGLSIALDNLKHFTGSVQQSRDINLFLKPAVDAAAAERVAETLRGRADVAAVALRTPEQGLAELRDNAGLGDAIAALDDNPLPTLLIVTPAGDDDARLAQSLQGLPQADLVQHDALWRKRLDGWLGFGSRLVQVLSVLLGLGAILVVGNTVRLDIQSRREEIGVLQLLGASDGFIRRPFLYLGTWYGLGAGALALALIGASGLALRPPLAALSQSYGSPFVLHGLDLLHSALVLAGTALLGWLGAWLVAGHFLRQTRPTET